LIYSYIGAYVLAGFGLTNDPPPSSVYPPDLPNKPVVIEPVDQDNDFSGTDIDEYEPFGGSLFPTQPTDPVLSPDPIVERPSPPPPDPPSPPPPRPRPPPPPPSSPIPQAKPSPPYNSEAIPEKHKQKRPPPPAPRAKTPPSPKDASGSSSGSGGGTSSTTTIIIAVACSVGGVLLIVFTILLCCFCRKGRKNRMNRAPGDLERGGDGAVGVKPPINGTRNTSSAKHMTANPMPNRSSFNRNTYHSFAPKGRLESNPVRGGSNGSPMGPMAAAFAATATAGSSYPVRKNNRNNNEHEVRSPAPKPKTNATAQWLGLNPSGPGVSNGARQTSNHRAGAHVKANETKNMDVRTMPSTRSDVSLHSKRESSTSTLLSSCDIDFSTIEIDREIGKGSFGKIFMASWNETPVAVKFLVNWEPKDRFQSLNSEFLEKRTETLLPTLEAEAEILSMLRHPNVVQYLGVCTDPSSMCIVTEYCSNGNLTDVLMKSSKRRGESKPLTWDLMTRMLLDAATGMLYLHSREIIHCDLKSNNILVDAFYRTKICDFNMSKLLLESTGNSLASVQNPRWLAPELCGGMEGHSKASDVYSFGIIMWEALTRKIPWHTCRSMEIVSLIRDGGRPPMPNFWDVEDDTGQEFVAFDEYTDLMTRCWSQNPYDRPNFTDIIKELKEISLFASSGAGTHHNESLEDNDVSNSGADPKLFSNVSTKVFMSNTK
jgi:serine/threonine protein kinase